MKGHTIVMKVPPVLMWLKDSTVPVTLDSLGMVPSVRVRMTALLVRVKPVSIVSPSYIASSLGIKLVERKCCHFHFFASLHIIILVKWSDYTHKQLVMLTLLKLYINNSEIMCCLTVTDIDECGEKMHNCHENATCSDVVGGFNCSCNTGFTGNGTFCEGKLSSVLELWSACPVDILLDSALIA